MNFDVGSFLIFALFMVLPALIFVAVYAVIVRRRGKFKRQRITGGSGRHRHKHEGSEADEEA